MEADNRPLMKQVHFDLHTDLFERLKIVAVRHNVSLRVLLTRMVYRYLKELEEAPQVQKNPIK